MLGSDDPVGAQSDESDLIKLSSDEPAPRQTIPTPAVAQPQVPAAPLIKRETEAPQRFEVQRISEDTLYSPSFTDHNYFVHVSPSYSILVIRPDPMGTVYCIGNKIRLEGLGSISGFSDKKYLRAENSKEYGGMLVRLI